MKQPTLLDGAIGTELMRRGVDPGDCPDWQCIASPSTVAAIHTDYRRAGAEALTTSSFGANRYRLAAFELEDRVREINLAAGRLAREVAGDGTVLGSIGPTGEGIQSRDLSAMRAAFREQASALNEAGVDIFSCETFGDVGELRAAVEGIRDVSSRPIWAQMTFLANLLTPLGLTAGEAATAMASLDVQAIGVNCAVGEGTIDTVLGELSAATSVPLVARPNAGQPAISRNRPARYPMSPDSFAALLARLSQTARFVGGCCGTTPAHIAAARKRLES